MLAEYLKELQKVPLLSADQEQSHWHRYRRHGDDDSRLRLIESYQPLVFKVVMQLRPSQGLVMDMIQEGTVGLIQAVERFDHERGVRFSTFAAYRIRGRILNSLRHLQTAGLSLDGEGEADSSLATRLADPSSEEALRSVEDAATAQQMRHVIESLPPRERTILRATYVEAREPRSVASELRISLSHFYRLQKQALLHIRRLILEDTHQHSGAAGY